MIVWIGGHPNATIPRQKLTFEPPKKAESSEVRTLEFEVKTDKQATKLELSAYALYNICEDEGGQCLFLRKDVPIVIPIRKR